MRAIDTNIVVRFLVADNKEQAAAARGAIDAGDIFAPTTVLLETEWVLRSAYGFSPDQIVESLRNLAGLPGVTVQDPARLAQALDWTASGMDFADALHLSAAVDCTAFLSFDAKLAKAAAGRSVVPVEHPVNKA